MVLLAAGGEPCIQPRVLGLEAYASKGAGCCAMALPPSNRVAARAVLSVCCMGAFMFFCLAC